MKLGHQFREDVLNEHRLSDRQQEGEPAVPVSRLQEHRAPRAGEAADRRSAHAVGIDRPGLRPRGGARGRRRSDAPACRRAARRAHHRAWPRARRGRPRRARYAGRNLAGEFLRPLHPRQRPASGAARSELHRLGPRGDGREGPLQVHHHQARRLSVAERSQLLAAGAHPSVAVRHRVHLAPGDADVFPGRSADSRSIRSRSRSPSSRATG